MYAEWEKQRAIVLIYPHMFCAFNEILEETQNCYDSLLKEILPIEDVYLIVHPDDLKTQERIKILLHEIGRVSGTCHLIELKSNDVWARDSIALSIKRGMQTGCGEFANFGFNGWGLKYPASFDNQLNANLFKQKIFSNMITHDLILEGGSIDTNGEGILLTNTQCLLEKNRNPHFTKEQIAEKLRDALGVHTILWLNHGYLEGDDTDGHIDTLARFVTRDTIVYIQCTDSNNPHHKELHAMEEELKVLAMQYNFKLRALPFCEYKLQVGDDVLELPASYVNFLFLNENTLLVPIYNKPTDALVLETFKEILPQYRIVGINCEALIREHGSLHCVSMQIH